MPSQGSNPRHQGQRTAGKYVYPPLIPRISFELLFDQANEEVSKNLQQIKAILFGDGG